MQARGTRQHVRNQNRATRRHLLAAAFLAAAAAGSLQATIVITNNSFELPNVSGGVTYSPSSAGWTFAGNSGVIGTGYFTSGAEDGVQVGFLQQFNGDSIASSISQTLTGFTIGNSYEVTFYTALRPSAPTVDPFEVLLGGTVVGNYSPSSNSWASETTSSIVAGSGSLTLQFLSTLTGTLSGSEVDSGIDNVAIVDLGPAGPSGVPEPASILLLGGGLAALIALRRS
jgi:hypothetical protein